MNAPIRTMPAVSPGVELLLLTHPLIRILHGARKDSYMRAWTRLALAEARNVTGDDARALPDNPKAALLALHEAVLEMGENLGIERGAFFEAYTRREESGAIPEAIGRVTERAIAMLTLFCARRIEREL
jgi:hypothetical protein